MPDSSPDDRRPPSGAVPGIAARTRRLLQYEADVAFRRRACTVLRFVDPQPGDRILDDGCGLGFYLHLLCRLSDAAIWGVEIDARRLESARQDPHAARARIVRGDVTSLPFPDAAFHKLISSEVLEHLEDDAAAAGEMARVLRPGGICAITVPHATYPMLWDPVNYVRESLGLGHFASGPFSGIWTDHRRLYSRSSIVELIESAGLEVTDVRLETRYAFPFSHNIVYGLGKFLVEKHLAGRGPDGRASRFALWTDERRLTPARILASVITTFDRLNRECYDRGPTVSICLRAVKPA